MAQIEVTRLIVYPVKGCKGIACDAALLTPLGECLLYAIFDVCLRRLATADH